MLELSPSEGGVAFAAWVYAHPEAAVALFVLVLPVAASWLALRWMPAADAAASGSPADRAAPRRGEPPAGVRPGEADAGWAERLSRTREALVGRLGILLGGRQLNAEILADLEALLLGADLGVKSAESLLAAVRSRVPEGDAEAVRGVLREEILCRLVRVETDVAGPLSPTPPHVVLLLGVNGSGKTTTAAKLAARYAVSGKRVILGACDTYRAAAVDQLATWAERIGCDVVRGSPGADAAAVAFDTVRSAMARECDVAVIDTAGRLQTEAPLVAELSKIVRVIGRACPGAPHDTLLVLDANTGQNAISQTRVFAKAVDATGIILTKLDGTAKGGVLVGLADEFGLPVRFVGVGEGVEDLREFSARDFVDALFA